MGTDISEHYAKPATTYQKAHGIAKLTPIASKVIHDFKMFLVIAVVALCGFLYGQNTMYAKYDGFYPTVMKLYDFMLEFERNK